MSAVVHRSPLPMRDVSARERTGRLVLAERWQEELGRPSPHEGFRIVLLLEPRPDARAEGAVAVCLPEVSKSVHRAGEAVPTYAALGSGLDPRLLEQLARGRVVAGLPLKVSPRQAFSAGGPAGSAWRATCSTPTSVGSCWSARPAP